MGIGDILFGRSGTPDQLIDTTATEFQNLRDPLANQLTQQLIVGPQQFGQPLAAGITPTEQQGLQQVQQAAGQVGQAGTGQQTLQQFATGAQQNPFANFTPEQQAQLQQLLGQVGPSAQQQQIQQVLGQQIAGQTNPFAQAQGLTGTQQSGLQQIQQQAFGQSPLQNTVNQQLGQIAGTGTHPQLQQLIDTAQRPILENFDEAALAQRGLFTGAGQQVQGQGSSPFARASALLSGRTASALGDVATNVTSQLNAQQQQAQLQALGMAQQQPGLTLQGQLAGFGAAGLEQQTGQLGLNLQNQAFQQNQQQQLAAAGLSEQASGNQFTQALAGLQASGIESGQQQQAFAQQQQQQLGAGAELSQVEAQAQTQQLQAQLQNLQAQGLPRLIEQLGINAGLQEFQRQQQEILQRQQLIGGLSADSTRTLQGQQPTGGLVQSAVGGLATGFGSTL